MEISQKDILQPVFDSKPFLLRDGWARLIGITIISILMFFTFDMNEMRSADAGIWSGFFVSFIYTVAYWEGIRLIWFWLQNKYRHYSETRKRLGILILFVLVYGVVVTILIQNTAAQLLEIRCTTEMMVWGYMVGLVPTVLVLTVYETVYYFLSWKIKVQETEAISRTHLQTQLEALKSQLDPHFLFNSLNTLSSLIDENEPAQQYLNKLSDVYRYVLLSKDRNTVTLREEMEFVNAFLYLAQVRFGNGFEVEICIPDDVLDQNVAPLSVQLLLENALKHNIITREKPLQIQIEIYNGYLKVRNEIHPKIHFESSTKIGLKNIMERYKLLTEKPVQILKDQIYFEVSIPLMPPVI